MKSFTAAMNATFRTKDEGVGAFGAQLKALTRADKLWFHRELNAAGIECSEPVESPVAAAQDAADNEPVEQVAVA
jgi:hypothetical protein